jgi:predicted dienelactone hydrolase
VGLVASLSLNLGILPALSADKISFTYTPLPEINISVTDLEAFAKDGTISPDLAFFAQLATPEQLTELQQILRKQFVLSPTIISQFANTQTGRVVFNRLGEILKNSSNQNGSKALQQAFQSAAADPKGVTLLSVIRQFPDPTIKVDGRLSFKAISDAIKIFRDQNAIFTALQLEAAKASPPENPLPSINLQQAGSVKFQTQTITYRNPSRLAAFQTITADVYLPITLPNQPPPLVVISHGVASDRNTFAYLARHLASHGFAVAVLQHPGSDAQRVEQFIGGQLNYNPALAAQEILNRPLDVKLLLDNLQRRVATQPTWRGRVNPQQVGVLGQSLGGYTALAVAGAPLDQAGLRQSCLDVTAGNLSFNLSLSLQCDVLQARMTQTNYRDERVKAVLALNSVGSLFFGETGMGQIQIPTLMIAGSDDIFAPPIPEQVTPFSWLKTPQRYLVLVDKGTHFSFLSAAKGVLPVPPELVGPDPRLAQPALQSLSTAFFSAYLRDQTQYLPLLSQAAVQSLIQPPFRMSLLTSVTPTQLQVAQPATPSPAR